MSHTTLALLLIEIITFLALQDAYLGLYNPWIRNNLIVHNLYYTHNNK